jgi:hypothetical protein
MTEQEWLECTSPTPMLEFLAGRASERKLRLFACACCRRVWRAMVDERSRTAVETAERIADGTVAGEDVRTIADNALAAVWGVRKGALIRLERSPREAAYRAVGTGSRYRNRNARNVASDAATASAFWGKAELRDGYTAEQVAQAGVLRGIFGNPFRPVTSHPSWLTPTVLSLAQAAYDDRHLPEGTLELSRLAVLADALEEAGCSEPAIFEHLRSNDPHVRGCWVVDLLLGKQ